MPLTTASVRLHPRLGDPAGNLAASVAAIEAAGEAGARLIVLPELCTSGYCFADDAEADAACQPIPGPATEAWAALARRFDAVIVAGLAERDADRGCRRNSAVAVGPDGVLAVYRKVHLWGRECEWFAPGDETPPVVVTPVGRIGIGVCYDLWFPEFWRSLADHGAEVLAFPSNLTDAPPIATADHVYTAVARTAAHLTRVPVVVADRCGSERGTTWVGLALIVDGEGGVIGRPARDDDSPETVLATLPDPAPRTTDLSPWNDVIGDRRPDVLGG